MVAVFEGNWEMAQLGIPGMITRVRRNSLVPFVKADGRTCKRVPFRGYFGQFGYDYGKLSCFKE